MRRLTHPSSIRWIHETNSSIKVPGYLLHDTNLTKLEFSSSLQPHCSERYRFFFLSPPCGDGSCCSPDASWLLPMCSRVVTAQLPHWICFFFRSRFFGTFRARATSPFLVLLSRSFKIKWSGTDRNGGNDGLTLIFGLFGSFFPPG